MKPILKFLVNEVASLAIAALFAFGGTRIIYYRDPVDLVVAFSLAAVAAGYIGVIWVRLIYALAKWPEYMANRYIGQ